jgi:hypothetical protein
MYTCKNGGTISSARYILEHIPAYYKIILRLGKDNFMRWNGVIWYNEERPSDEENVYYTCLLLNQGVKNVVNKRKKQRPMPTIKHGIPLSVWYVHKMDLH